MPTRASQRWMRKRKAPAWSSSTRILETASSSLYLLDMLVYEIERRPKYQSGISGIRQSFVMRDRGTAGSHAGSVYPAARRASGARRFGRMKLLISSDHLKPFDSKRDINESDWSSRHCDLKGTQTRCLIQPRLNQTRRLIYLVGHNLFREPVPARLKSVLLHRHARQPNDLRPFHRFRRDKIGEV